MCNTKSGQDFDFLEKSAHQKSIREFTPDLTPKLMPSRKISAKDCQATLVT